MQNSVLQGFRLSPRQQHLWWAQRTAGSAGFVVRTRIEITGALDLRRLRRAVEKAVERHEILRTTFPLLPSLSVPVQSVEESAAVEWSEQSDPETPFDLANGPLLRAALTAIETEHHTLVLTQPALAADGVSLDLLAAEIAAAYHGSSLEGDVFQYADLAELLHDWQGAPAEEPGPAFWRGQDLSALVRVTLAMPGGEPGSRTIERAPVAAAAARLGTSVSTILLAAWQAALHLATGAEEIVVATLFDGRTCEELETALGPFAHYLPVRTRSNVDSTLAELSRALSLTLDEISRRQDFFSAEPVEKLLAEHGLAGWPFGFDVRRPPALPTAPGAPVFAIVGGHLDLDGFGVRLSVFDDGRSLRADLTDSILLERFCRVLDGLLAGSPLGEIDVLTEAEQRQVLAFNRTESEAPVDLCAHHLFEEQVRRAPDAPAVIHAETAWTYAELNARANQLAHHLRAMGLRPGSLIGISLDRSPELVAAVLGVLKAGAAYVPLDPGSPAERLAWMAEDAGISLLLTRESIVSAQIETDPPRTAGPDDLAYVIYTSGSTGRPKGVMIPHRGLVNYLLWARQAYAAGSGAGAPVHSAIGFDLTVTSLLVPLAAGSAVTLLGDESPLEALAAALRGSPGFSLVKLTPAHLDGLRSVLPPDEYGGATNALVIGGEALRAESVAPWREHAPRTRLINEYGPTEATVGCCVYEIAPGDPLAGPVAIGRPIANTRLHVTGPRLQPLPFGAPGELLIGGAGLARGYLGRPELTAERFVPDPWPDPWPDPFARGERLYRTGDLVRLRPDGNLEFLGRIDHQIKLRGYRIEPGEIEAALVSHPDVREAAVLVAEGDLVACIAANIGKSDAAALRHHLLGRLPEYMLPARFVFFASLPLTPNGKVDRKELERTWLDVAGAAAEPAAGEAPRSWTEELLAGMFAELLGLPRVGRGESFFALGGHSLLATQAVSRIRAAFGVEMTLRALFEAPTVAALAVKVEALRARGEAPVAPPLGQAPRQGVLPLSFAQQRLWFIAQLAPGSALYNIPLALRVEGPLNAQVLAASLGEIVRRHEALRTVFAMRDGTPGQEIQPSAPFELPVVDLSALPESRRESQALALTATEASRPFDLARGPLLRGLLLRLTVEDCAVALTMHHIASDGWSIGILVREVMALYPAFAAGRPSPLPELAVQYADFSWWQQSWLRGAVLESEIAFWREQLAGLPPRLDLPTDRLRPGVQSFRGAIRSFRLPAGLIRQAETLSRRDGATLFMVLLAGLQALLARWSGQQDLAVGTTIAGRNLLEIEGLIGFFVNTLVLRGDLSGEPTFRELLARVRNTALAAHAHQDVPFERLIQELAPERSLAQTPLFQVMFMLQNAPVENLEIADLRLRSVGAAGTTAKFDLTLSLGEHDEGLDGTAEYATDLYDAATIDRLLGQYVRLLSEALAAPERTAAELPLLSPAEQHQVLVEWNDTAVGSAPEATLIHQPFEVWAARTPGAIAAVCGGEALTYGEVEEQARRLAAHLASLGIGPGALVGIHLRRSLAMIPAVLAVLKAGAAYVPLEIGHPPARLRWILGTLEISCLLTETAQLAAVRALEITGLSEVVCVDRPETLTAAALVEPQRATPDDLAYIIFTSGSTGTPKGVMVRHRPVINLLRWAHRTFAFSPADRVLCVASLAFDLSVFDIFGLLGAGGSIRIATEEEIRDPQCLLKALAEEPITFWDSAPAALEQTVPFLSAMDPQAHPALRLVFLSGDWIPVTLPDRIRARFPGARGVQIIALGGATEATVWSNVFPVGAVDPAWPSIPYGRPIDNARYHVLDARLSPCPIGVPGDLYIGGDCLAEGYAREPELTAQKFIPDPRDGRLYRTGDRARSRPDGNLEFLGRRDSQVKIRGFRIELGEIEAALSALPGVREAVVALHEDRLIAYVTGEAGDSATLRESLRERLPEPMIPSAFLRLDVLPLTANGKVDRKALPAPEWRRSTGSTERYIAPRTPVEEVLAGIWSEVLGAAAGETIGAADHFFERGGHSLLATQVVSRLHGAFGVELPLRDLFEAPVLADLAARIEAAQRAGAGLAAPPLVALAPQEGPLPLSFAQQRLWFLDQFEPASPLYNIPVALRVAGPLQAGVLAPCLGEIVRRHESLRTAFALRDGAPVQVIQPAAPFGLAVVDLAGLPASRREALALILAGEEATRPFDLTRGPLLRGVLLRLAADDCLAALTLHHIAGDAWSMGILVREMMALYAAFGEGRPSPLPELNVQYADFAAWQRSWLHGEILANEIAFWRRQLAGLPLLLALPTDRPRPAARSFRGATRPVRLPAGLTRQARDLGRREGATLFMVLLAAFQALLARLSGQQDLAVGSPVAGRNRVEIEGLIGFFVNTLVLRGDLTGEPSFHILLARTRETALAAQTHQDLPFEKLVQELAPERSLAHTPLFQVVFGLHNAPVESVDLQGLRLRPVDTAGTMAKFDLTLNLEEHDGGLSGAAKHATDLFDGTTIGRLIAHFERLLTAALAAPELPVSELPLLTAAERHQLQTEWGGQAGEPPPAATLHGRFEAQARRTPDAPALSYPGTVMSYGELSRRSDHLARRLRSLGAGPEIRVGLCLERSPELVVGILGILKAGGAYVPLDPAYPRERLVTLIEDAGVEIVVTAPENAAVLPDTVRQMFIADPGQDHEPLETLPAGDLAYVIHTSGSTGHPKGVAVTHGNVARLFAATQPWFGFDAQDVWPLFHSYAFDFSVWEIWGALLHGGRLVIVPFEVSRSPNLLFELLVREQVTVLNQTPSAFAQIAAQSTATGLRLVLFGGEALDPAALAPWFARHGDERPRLVNLYGITETTVHVTYRPLRAADAQGIRRSTIGAPIPDLSLAVMDPHLNPAPLGIPGELAIGGAGLARGYLGRPELTAECFVPDPAGGRLDRPGARLYRSGDLGRFLPTGDVEYLGRIDHQVKIRGFRIELGEIEAVLAAQPGVRETVVIARADRSDRRLVAYVTGEATISADALRQALRDRLPEHMVPAAFMVLDALPLTPHGKIDRKALPAPERQSAAVHPAPRTPLEQALAALWCEALGVESVGVDDSFFDLGGNSITGVILINRLQREVGRIIHVAVLFDAPTVAKMAAYLAREHREAVRAPEAVHRVDAAQVATLRALIRPLAPPARAAAKNPPAVFLLSPPRSGSTLLRVMLGGHPRLFAPPELELLSFATLADREAAFAGRDSFWLEGVIRAVMEVHGCDVEAARRILRTCVAEGWTTQRFYRQLQEWLGARTLVDKTPSYALDPVILRQAEESFESPFYIHLVRHPYAVIRSFEEASLDQIFFRHPHSFRRGELAELIWLVSHQNIADFLAAVPAERQLQVRFEDLVRDPEAGLRRICAALEIDFHPHMADPYQGKRARMTDGIHAEGRMLGDVKFLQYKSVEAGVAERWREAREDSLGELTWEMALRFGYEPPAPLPKAVAIPRAVAREGLAPLSFAQQRLWFIDQLEPGSPLYNIPVALRVEGRLDSAVLAHCLGEIVRRHEALRTVFTVRQGEPAQAVQPAAPFQLAVVDLAALPESRREAAALRLAADEAARPFDLTRGLLLRGMLLRLAADDRFVTLTLHHIAGDGWSLRILIREITALYAAFAEGRPSPLPEPAVQYADFAAWQRSWLQGEILESEIAFWRRQLAGLPPLLGLPTDRPRPAAQSFRGATRPVRLPAGLAPQLEALSRREGATLFMVLLAAFQALLARHSGQQDLAVGSPIAGRNRVEIEGLIGFFVNTLVLRGDLSGEPSFRELLARVRKTALAAQTHQDLPFEKLVQELAPERSLAHTPLFQVVLSLQNARVESVDLQGLRLRPVETAGTTAKFDFSLNLEEHNGGLGGAIEYATDLFDGTTIDRLIAHFARLLTAALAAPELPVSELPLLTAAERHQLQTEWGGCADETPADSIPLHQLHRRFKAQARQTPDAPALTWNGVVMSYGELDRRSDQLARRLHAHGAGPESRVGLCLERSPELVVGLLGILKAGGAYVPLDPAAPRERLAFMSGDSGMEIAVTAPETAAVLPAAVRPVFVADSGQDGEPVESFPAGDLAYVIYTSGSTGRPKGVAVTHANVARLFAATQHWFGFSAEDVWTLFHSYAFDFSVWEIWGALLHGGRLVIVPFDVSRSPELFFDLLSREKVTVLNQTPSAFAQLASYSPSPGRGEGVWERGLGGEGRKAADLRLVIFGGEALDPAALAPWFARHGDETPRLVNMYGITETTVHVTYRPLRAADARGVRRSAIGIPIPDLSLAVMDPHLRPAPLGVPGELAIGGAGLARAYLGRPELTAERFVPDPAGGHPGARLYRSGDLGRFLPTGDVEYLGRIDHQVKIRGFRIELGEIEALLAALPGVREAVVTVREERSGDRRLTAYVTGDVPADALRKSLRERLPDYMVPAAFVRLDALPLTANGKVDRKALPAPERQSAAVYLAPRTPVEKILAGLWADLLGFAAADRIGVDAHFFDLGGHSLLATRLMAAVRDAFRVDLPLRLLFEQPTLEGLARSITETKEPDSIDLIALPRRPGENRFPVSLSQLDEWLLNQQEPDNPIYNISSSLRIEGPLAIPSLLAALHGLVHRHEVFRTRFAAGDGEPEPLQIVLPEVRLAVPLLDLSALPESRRDGELRRQARDAASTDFDLSLAPLLRTRIVRLAAADHALLLTVRHIIADGWSMGILLRELAVLYEAAARGVSPALPALPIQYGDFAAWQRRRLDGAVLERQMDYWRQRLAGAPPFLTLPTDRPRPPVRRSHGSKVPFHLPQPLAGRLEELARRHGATLFMLLLASFQTLLGRWSGQQDVVVGTYRGDRPRRELEGLIGYFISTLPLRTRLAESPSFAMLLDRVRDETLAAYAHSDVPFDYLLQALDLPDDPSRTQLIQALLVLHSFPPAQIELSSGVRLSTIAAKEDTADYDLELWLAAGPDGTAGVLRYSTDLFDESTILRFAAELRALLAAAVENPEQDLRTLGRRSILDADFRHRLDTRP